MIRDLLIAAASLPWWLVAIATAITGFFAWSFSLRRMTSFGGPADGAFTLMVRGIMCRILTVVALGVALVTFGAYGKAHPDEPTATSQPGRAHR